MNTPAIYEYISPFLDKSIVEYNLRCPLYYFASSRFKEILLNCGYELVHPEGLYYLRSEREFVYFETAEYPPYSLQLLTTLEFSKLEELFAFALREEYKNKYLLIRGLSLKMQEDFKAPEFDQIKNTISNTVVSKLENSLYHFENFCDKYSKTHLSNTLGLLFYAPPGYGKSFILRSFLKKLLKERGFTVVQIHQAAIIDVNLSQLLDSCKTLFPCVLFIEDMDLMFYDRKLGRSATGELLETLEGLYQAENVVILATSNSVDEIDKALLRPGRFDYLIELETPSYEAKKVVLSEYMKDIDFEVPETILERLIEASGTFAELKGGFQHLVRTYMGTNEFPEFKEIEDMTNAWKESRTNGVTMNEKKRVGLI